MNWTGLCDILYEIFFTDNPGLYMYYSSKVYETPCQDPK